MIFCVQRALSEDKAKWLHHLSYILILSYYSRIQPCSPEAISKKLISKIGKFYLQKVQTFFHSILDSHNQYVIFLVKGWNCFYTDITLDALNKSMA